MVPKRLALLARFCIAHDAIALCDEVWDHVVFDGRAHRSLMALPGMAERSVKIGSAGKIFGFTGWKVGFVLAAPPLLRVLSKAHQFLTFTTPPNLQSAVAFGLGKPDEAFTAMRAGFSAPATSWPRASWPAASMSCRPGHLFPQRRPRAARHHGRCRVLRDAGGAPWRSGRAGLGLLCRERRAQRGAVLLFEDGRDPRSGARPARDRRR